MPDDASQPPSSFFPSPSHSLARLTHFIDDNIRIIQYGVYCAGAAGVVLVLHSVRAFTKFVRVQDIPKEFITKHVRLHGHVRWVGGAPPTPAAPPHAHALPLLPENGTRPTPFSSAAETEGTPGAEAGGGGRSLSADNRGIYEGAGELHPWEDGIDPALDRINYVQDLTPIFLQVEHSPVITLLRRKSGKTDHLLPIQLADVEVTRAGAALVSELVGRRVWFTLISQNTEDDTLACFLKPTKLFSRSVNERLMRDGLGLVGPMDLELHGDKRYTHLYTRLLKAQEYAEKKQLGIWKPSEEQRQGLLARLWKKIRSPRRSK